MKKSGSEPQPRTLQEIADANQPAKGEVWELRLYVAGQTPRSIAAFANLKKICEEHLAGRYNIEVVDLVKHPQLAAGDQILAIPTLVRAVRRGRDNRHGHPGNRLTNSILALARIDPDSSTKPDQTFTGA